MDRSKTAVKNHLQAWSTKKKNLPKKKAKVMYQIAQQRALEGKETLFRHHGSEVPLSKIKRAWNTPKSSADRKSNTLYRQLNFEGSQAQLAR